jgi:alginate O-acetyltransferase complex protein AlgI
MLFCSNIFLFAFFPIVLLLYFILPRTARNPILLISSLIFYFYGEGWQLWILISICLLNYVAARVIASFPQYGTLLLAAFISINLLMLIYYKYFTFITYILVPDVLGVFGISTRALSGENIILPIGISFFTFHAISYLVDIRLRKIKPSESPIDFGMYFVFFAHLIAGPIVRYSELEGQIRSRIITANSFSRGIYRFSLGLGKKIIIADSLSTITNRIYGTPFNEISTSLAWLAIVAYSFQIYFDFSGYTDMGIGLAKIFGFDFPENFEQPYRAQSVTEFWRRWHMTLSRWFRDYLYIPLGGNQSSLRRTCINLLLVFFLCGLWHGASYPFIVWGLYYGVLLSMERILLSYYGVRLKGAPGMVATFFLVTLGWVFFRSPNLEFAFKLITIMFNPTDVNPYLTTSYYLTNDKIFTLAIAFAFSFIPFDTVNRRLESMDSGPLIKAAIAIPITSYSIILMAMNGFKPFIYFQF